jgi:hypothetical protein
MASPKEEPEILDFANEIFASITLRRNPYSGAWRNRYSISTVEDFPAPNKRMVFIGQISLFF